MREANIPHNKFFFHTLFLFMWFLCVSKFMKAEFIKSNWPVVRDDLEHRRDRTPA